MVTVNLSRAVLPIAVDHFSFLSRQYGSGHRLFQAYGFTRVALLIRLTRPRFAQRLSAFQHSALGRILFSVQ
jgi:hypothetical protein